MKKIARVLASSTLKITLFSAAVTAAIIGVVGSPDGVKQTLNDSKVYDSVVESVFEHISQEQAKDGDQTDSFNINHPEIKQAAQTALDPATLQNSTEQIIDGFYRWLDGEVETPDFNIDLSAAKQNFIATAAQQAEDRVAGLPVCTPQQTAALGSDVDPFTATCKPSGYSVASARQQVESELANGDFLKNTTITPDTLRGEEDTEDPFKKDLRHLPDSYQKAKRGPWVLLGLSALLAAVVFFASETYRKGTKSLGKTLLGVGIFTLIGGLLTGMVLRNMLEPAGAIGKLVDNSLQQSVLSLLRSISNNFSNTMIIYSVAYILLGTAALLALKFFWKNEPATVTAKPVAPKQPAAKPKK